MSDMLTARRKGALSRLNVQLKKGTKQNKGSIEPLTESNRNRIQHEINILEKRTQ